MNLQDYAVVSTIGNGGFALVKRLRHKTTGEEIALKELTKDSLKVTEYRQWFEREVKILKTLNGHENVVTLLHNVISPTQCVLAMPIAKYNLEKHMELHNSQVDLAHRVGLFEHILAGMCYAHEKEILHRDLAPQNVLVFEDEQNVTLKLADFGLGKRLDSGSVVTSTSDAFGRSYYIAPEVVDSLKACSKASDVFSMGRVLQYILTGKIPTRKYSGEFGSVITKATADDPSNRYQSANELKSDFERHKALIFAPPVKPMALLEMMNSKVVDWPAFHKMATKDNYDDPYSDYLNPINEILKQEGNLEAYYGEIGEDIGSFVEAYRRALNNLPGVGWPFDDAPSFSYTMKLVYDITQDDQTKLACLKEIWHLAYKQDRWAAQDILDELLLEVPKSIEHDFAAVIADTKGITNPQRLARLKLSQPLRNAVNASLQNR